MQVLAPMQAASQEHILSMVVMLNEKFRENVSAWDGFEQYPELIPAFFQKLFSVPTDTLRMHQRVSFLVFFIHAFQSLENEAISRQVLRLVQLPLWHSLSAGRLQVSPFALPFPAHPFPHFNIYCHSFSGSAVPFQDKCTGWILCTFHAQVRHL